MDELLGHSCVFMLSLFLLLHRLGKILIWFLFYSYLTLSINVTFQSEESVTLLFYNKKVAYCYFKLD